MQTFWNDEARGQGIEDFIHKQTTKNPLLMLEVLRLGLGDLCSWTDTGVVVGAKCGCLIGTCAIAADRIGMVDAAAVVETPQCYDIVTKTLAKAIARGNERAHADIHRIGCDVAEECDTNDDTSWADREDEVREYLEDLITVDLRLLGFRV